LWGRDVYITFYAIIALPALLYTVIKKLTYTQPSICIFLTGGTTDRSFVFLPTYCQLHVLQHSHTTTCSIWKIFSQQNKSAVELKQNYTGQNDGKSHHHKNGTVSHYGPTIRGIIE
jgi:hypothetical protein